MCSYSDQIMVELCFCFVVFQENLTKSLSGGPLRFERSRVVLVVGLVGPGLIGKTLLDQFRDQVVCPYPSVFLIFNSCGSVWSLCRCCWWSIGNWACCVGVCRPPRWGRSSISMCESRGSSIRSECVLMNREYTDLSSSCSKFQNLTGTNSWLRVEPSTVVFEVVQS